MQQNHPAFLVDIENYPRDPVLRQFAPHFIEPVSHWPENGIPTGQPNSTVLMSSPIRLRSSGDARLFNQSRTGSPPASVRKKIAGTCFPCLSSVPAALNISVGTLNSLPTGIVYHIRYEG